MKYTFPIERYGQECILLPVDKSLVPLISGALNKFFDEYVWETRIDYQLGYNAFAEVLSNMANECLTELVESNRQIYRLLDTALNGTQYAVADGTVTPPIPPVPPASTSEGNAMRAHIGRLWSLAENAHTGATFSEGAGIEGGAELPASLSWAARLLAIQGETPGGWFGIGAKPVQLLDILKASRLNTEEDRSAVSQALGNLDDALDVGTDLGTFLQGLLAGAADLGTDGGVIITQLVTAAATARLLQRVNQALDGGEIIVPSGPDNNVLTLLANLATRIGDPSQPALADLLGNIDVQTATLYDVRIALRQLAGQEAAGQLAAGSVAALQLALLECICEGVNGTPAEFPPFVTSDCDPSFTLRAQVSTIPFDNQGVAVLDFEVQGGAGTITTTLVPGVGTCLVVGASGPREICMQVVRAGGAENEILGIVCTPVRVSNGGEGGRPGVQLQGLAGGDSGTFWGDASDNGEQIAYYCTIATGIGTPPAGQYRLYLAAGAVG